MHSTPISAPFQENHDLDQLLREQEAAALLGHTVRALQNWRVRGGGPPFVNARTTLLDADHRAKRTADLYNALRAIIWRRNG